MKKENLATLTLLAVPMLMHATATLAADRIVPDSYATVGAAIEAAVAGDVVRIRPGTYTEKLTIRSNIELRGDETARVILESSDNGDAGIILTITGVDDVTIRNLTFSRGDTGISINTSLGVKISNNVFNLGNTSTGIEITDLDSAVTIRNNSFSGNDIAILSNASANIVTIENNIFSSNTTTLSPENSVDDVTYNCYASGDTPISNETPVDPAQGIIGFDHPAVLDFHLTSASVCIDLGPEIDAVDETDSDAGAFGGQLAEANPFPVQNLVASVNNDPANYSITLDWRVNNSYLIKRYKVYYGSEQSGTYNGTDAKDGFGAALVSPIPLLGGSVDSVSLSNLTGPATAPPAPTLAPLEPSFEQIRVNWSEVTGANGYILYWGLSSTDENVLEVGNVTTYTIPGLQNGTPYQVQVSAIKQARYYLAVSVVATSLIDNPADDEIESALSEEIARDIGSQLESARSPIQTAIPEEVVAFPSLPDQGSDSRCFIASSAYGNSNAAEVLALRQFRDRFLLQSQLGQRLVSVYYRISPNMANWLNQHPALKPFVKGLLLPVVWLAISLLYASPLQYGLLLFLSGLLLIARCRQAANKPSIR